MEEGSLDGTVSCGKSWFRLFAKEVDENKIKPLIRSDSLTPIKISLRIKDKIKFG